MIARMAEVERNTKETLIKCEVNIDGTGSYNVKTEIGFFSHMLETFSKHSCIDLDIEVKGDLHVDQHHSVEDTGIVIGEAIRRALGDKAGIERAGCFLFPMDEVLALAAIDLSGRPYFAWEASFSESRIGELDTAVIPEFFGGFVNGLLCNLHLKLLAGRNDHHKCEGLFKALAKSLKTAVSVNPRLEGQIPSTKGVI